MNKDKSRQVLDARMKPLAMHLNSMKDEGKRMSLMDGNLAGGSGAQTSSIMERLEQMSSDTFKKEHSSNPVNLLTQSQKEQDCSDQANTQESSGVDKSGENEDACSDDSDFEKQEQASVYSDDGQQSPKKDGSLRKHSQFQMSMSFISETSCERDSSIVTPRMSLKGSSAQITKAQTQFGSFCSMTQKRPKLSDAVTIEEEKENSRKTKRPTNLKRRPTAVKASGLDQGNQTFGGGQQQSRWTARQNQETPLLPKRPSSSEIQQVTQKLLLENPAPYVSAASWILLDRKKGDLLFGKCETEAKQVASLTKIMTSHCVLNLIENFKGESKYAGLSNEVKILGPVSQICGTSACLLEGDSLTIEQLMYGMMLPSGNDAATALGVYFGSLMLSNGLRDPNEAMVISPEALKRRFRAHKIQLAFNYERRRILRIRAEEKARLMEEQATYSDKESTIRLASAASINSPDTQQTETQSPVTTNSPRKESPSNLTTTLSSFKSFSPEPTASKQSSAFSLKLANCVQQQANSNLQQSLRQNHSPLNINRVKLNQLSNANETMSTTSSPAVHLQLKNCNNFPNHNLDERFGNESDEAESLSGDADEHNYFYKIRQIQKEFYKQNEELHLKHKQFQQSQEAYYGPNVSVSLRDLFDSDIFESLPQPEHYDLPVDYDEAKEMRKAEEYLLNEKINTALKAFYRVMNTTAAAVGMKKSNFAVAHGMHHNDNYSTAHEIALLARVALQQHSLLNTVVNTKHYQVASRVRQGHVYKWVNTNNMLWDTSGRGGQSAFFGVKTGITPSAGPCLCVNFRSPCGFDFIVVVLNCKSREARFVEIPKLCNWAINKILRVRRTNLRPGVKKRLLRNMAHV